MKKVLLSILLLAGAYYVYQAYGSTFLAKNSPQTKKVADSVLGAVTHIASDQASRSASVLDMVVFQQATKPVIEQYNKLPKEKQDEIKKQICR